MRSSITRSVVPVSRQIHRFRRMLGNNNVSGNVAYAPFQGSTTWTLSGVINSSEFSSLYEQYRIDYVQMKWYLRIDPSAQTAASASYPKLYISRDYDSSGLLSQSEMRERANTKIIVMNPNRPVTFGYKPNVLAETYRGTATTSYAPKWKQWLTMTANDVLHYGHIWNIDDLTNTNYKVDMEYTVWFSCKNTK